MLSTASGFNHRRHCQEHEAQDSSVWIDLRLKRPQRIYCKRCTSWSSMSTIAGTAMLFLFNYLSKMNTKVVVFHCCVATIWTQMIALKIKLCISHPIIANPIVCRLFWLCFWGKVFRECKELIVIFTRREIKPQYVVTWHRPIIKWNYHRGGIFSLL